MNIRSTAAAFLMLGLLGSQLPARSWTDSTGNYTVEADFVELKNGFVRLKKVDGKVIDVPLGKLSKGDREWVQREAMSEPARAKTGDQPLAKTETGTDGTKATGNRAVKPGSTKWVFDAGEGKVLSPAVGADGTVYAGVSDGRLFALSPEGQKRWLFQGDSSGGIPAIGPGGTIYFPSGWARAILHAVSPKGKKLWAFDAGDTIFGSPAIAPDGTIYIGAACKADAQDRSAVIALTPQGTEKWRFGFRYNHVSGYFAIAEDGTLYAVDGPTLHAFSPDGKEKWKWRMGAKSCKGAVIGSGGVLYITGQGPDGSKLAAIEPSGKEKWEINILETSPVKREEAYSCLPAVGKDGTVYAAAAFSGIVIPANVKGPVVVTGSKLFTLVCAVTPAGKIAWSVVVEDWMMEDNSPALGEEGTLFLQRRVGDLTAMAPGGKQLWSLKAQGLGAPVLTDDGTVYVGTADSKLIAVHSGSKGSADAPWPMLHQNPAHTAVAPK